MARLHVRRDSLERASGSMREIWESIEIETTPRAQPAGDIVEQAAHHPTGESDVTVFVEGRETFAGPLARLLASLGLTTDDLE